jgi:hypothetical protein
MKRIFTAIVNFFRGSKLEKITTKPAKTDLPIDLKKGWPNDSDSPQLICIKIFEHFNWEYHNRSDNTMMFTKDKYHITVYKNTRTLLIPKSITGKNSNTYIKGLTPKTLFNYLQGLKL